MTEATNRVSDYFVVKTVSNLNCRNSFPEVFGSPPAFRMPPLTLAAFFALRAFAGRLLVFLVAFAFPDDFLIAGSFRIRGNDLLWILACRLSRSIISPFSCAR